MLFLLLFYTTDIKPIVFKNCMPCHNQTAGPLNWLDYNNVYRERYRISAMIQSDRMPPVRKLSDADKETFENWIDQGALEHP